jgi:hypothetical protein
MKINQKQTQIKARPKLLNFIKKLKENKPF